MIFLTDLDVFIFFLYKGPFTWSYFKDPIFVGSENRIVWTHWKWPSDTRIRNFEKKDTLLERWKTPTNFAWYLCDRFGAKLKILYQFWKSARMNKWPFEILTT